MRPKYLLWDAAVRTAGWARMAHPCRRQHSSAPDPGPSLWLVSEHPDSLAVLQGSETERWGSLALKQSECPGPSQSQQEAALCPARSQTAWAGC